MGAEVEGSGEKDCSIFATVQCNVIWQHNANEVDMQEHTPGRLLCENV